MKNAHRILTFSGTIVEEAAQNRIKFISINSGLADTFDKELVWIPNNIKEFNSLLNDNLAKKNFKLSAKISKSFVDYMNKKIIRNRMPKLRWKNKCKLGVPVNQVYRIEFVYKRRNKRIS